MRPEQFKTATFDPENANLALSDHLVKKVTLKKAELDSKAWNYSIIRSKKLWLIRTCLGAPLFQSSI